MIKFRFDIDPVAKGRPRFWNGRAVTPPKTREFEKAIKTQVLDQYQGDKIEGAVSARITFFVARPKSVSEKKRPYPIVGADLDNYIKSLIDGVQNAGVVFDNDAQIIELIASKKYSNAGAIHLDIYRYDND